MPTVHAAVHVRALTVAEVQAKMTIIVFNVALVTSLLYRVVMPTTLEVCHVA
jgi:hypothetical protein